MCTNSRIIFNHYTRKAVRVSCGHCKECLQEMACRRANRIRNHSCFGDIALFVTLTYDPRFIPYVLRSEIEECKEVNIYRDSSVRFYRGIEIIRKGRVILDSVYITDYVDLKGIPSPRKSPSDYIGVCYYKDLQNFIKRLRINLYRDYPYDNIKLSFYSCSEYGSYSKRPHFHLLLFVKSDYAQKVQSAITKSWSFADRARTAKYVEIAKNAASYVASYVNCPFTDSSLLAHDAFRAKHSYSKGFGVRLQCFSLASILEKYRRGDLRYNVATFKDGVPSVSSFSVPEYVINRFFPKFKGYFLFAPNEVRELLLVPVRLFQEVAARHPLLSYSQQEKHEYIVLMSHIKDKFMSQLGWSSETFDIEYPSLFVGVWTMLKSHHLVDSFMDINFVDSLYEFYENSNELVNGCVSSDLLDILPDLDKYQQDPNSRRDLLNRHLHFVELYNKLDKNKRIVNYAMSKNNHFV